MILQRKLSVEELSEFHRFVELHIDECPADKTLLDFFLDCKKGQKKIGDY
jgi:hypothetical protein